MLRAAPALLVLALALMPGQTRAWESDSLRLDGETRIRFLARILTEDAGQDQDFLQTADLDLVEKPWGHLGLSLSGDLRQDIDGRRPAERVQDVRDTQSPVLHGYLYRAHADLTRLGPLERLRIGRQYVDGPLPAHLDGARLELRFLDRRLRLEAYGGLPVRFFDRDTEWWDAQQAGAAATGRLTGSTRLTAAYQFWGEAGDDGTEAAHQAALVLRQDLLELLHLKAAFVWLDERPRSLSMSILAHLDEVGFEGHLRYRVQVATIERVPTSASPFVALLGPSRPHHKVALWLGQRLADDVFLYSDTAARLLGTTVEDSEFNHGYVREALGLSVDDLLVDGLRIEVHGDLWNTLSAEQDTLVVAGGGEIRYRIPNFLRLSAGGQYSLYKYDYLLDDNEKTRVYTVFGRGRIFPVPWLYLAVDYELEIYDVLAHRLSVTIGQRI